MTKPWEEYQASAPTKKPWEEFQVAGSAKKPWEEFAAEPQEQPEGSLWDLAKDAAKVPGKIMDTIETGQRTLLDTIVHGPHKIIPNVEEGIINVMNKSVGDSLVGQAINEVAELVGIGRADYSLRDPSLVEKGLGTVGSFALDAPAFGMAGKHMSSLAKQIGLTKSVTKNVSKLAVAEEALAKGIAAGADNYKKYALEAFYSKARANVFNMTGAVGEYTLAHEILNQVADNELDVGRLVSEPAKSMLMVSGLGLLGTPIARMLAKTKPNMSVVKARVENEAAEKILLEKKAIEQELANGRRALTPKERDKLLEMRMRAEVGVSKAKSRTRDDLKRIGKITNEHRASRMNLDEAVKLAESGMYKLSGEELKMLQYLKTEQQYIMRELDKVSKSASYLKNPEVITKLEARLDKLNVQVDKLTGKSKDLVNLSQRTEGTLRKTQERVVESVMKNTRVRDAQRRVDKINTTLKDGRQLRRPEVSSRRGRLDNLNKLSGQAIMTQGRTAETLYRAGIKGAQTVQNMIDKRAQLVEKALVEAEGIVKSKLPKGSPEELKVATAIEFQNNLANKGIKLNDKPVLGWMSRAFWRNRETISRVDGSTGTDISHLYIKALGNSFNANNTVNRYHPEMAAALKQIKKAGVDPNKIHGHLWETRVEDGVPLFLGEAASLPQAAKDGLLAARTIYDDLFRISQKGGQPFDYRRGYVPVIRKPVSEVSTGGGKSAKSTLDPFFKKHREWDGPLDPNQHITDMDALGRIYINQAAHTAAYGEIIPGVRRELYKLNMMGKTKDAEHIAKIFSDMMGFRDSKRLGEIFADRQVDASKEMLAQIAHEISGPQDLGKELVNVFRNFMYNSTIFAKPNATIKNAFQPELVGWAELGHNIELARFDKAGLEMADKMMPYMREVSSGPLLQRWKQAILGDSGFVERSGKTSRWYLKGAERFGNIVGSPLRITFSAIDQRNRRLAFAGAWRQFKNEVPKGDMRNVLEGLLHGERQAVLKELQTNGIDEAAKLYGLIRSIRINFAYGLADAPAVMRSDLGRLIPFTTWGSNQMMRFGANLAGMGKKGYRVSSTKQLAKRIAYPIAFIEAFKHMTGAVNDGEQLNMPSGSHPASSISGGLPTSVMPPVANTISDFQQYGIGAAAQTAAKFIPGVSQLNTVRKYGKGGNAIDTFTGLKRSRAERNPSVEEYINSARRGANDLGRATQNYFRELRRGFNKMSR